MQMEVIDPRLTLPTGDYRTEEGRWTAVCDRDAEADGFFIYGVMTTGVYCKPSCPSRQAKRENVRFYDLHAEARAGGLRACKRCRPDEMSVEQRRSITVERACRRIEENDPDLRISALAEEMGISRHHFQRIFKAQTGLTPKAYQTAVRRRAVVGQLTGGASVTEAIHAGGYATSSRFYDGAGATLGMRPGTVRAGGAGEVIGYVHGDTSLGRIIVGFSAQGICATFFGDDDAALVEDLRARFPKAQVAPADDTQIPLDAVIAAVEGTAPDDELPLDIRGTAFQARVWSALRAIPAGETASYADVAERIGKPSATRAVAQACGANAIAVIVPCHRVVRADGSLSGYRWGVERKRAILEREAAGDAS